MNPIRVSAFLAFPFLGMLACHPSRKAVSSYNLMDTIRVSARNNPMDLYRATTRRIWDIRRTEVALSPDWQAREASCVADLEIVPLFDTPDTLVLDAKDMGIVSVKRTDINRELPFSYDSSSLRIDVAGWKRDRKAGAALSLRIVYQARPYANLNGGSAAIKEARGLYFINTDGATPGKPRQIWTQGETESNSNWIPTIDKPNQRTQITLRLHVPDTMQSLANGRLISSTPTGDGFRTDVWRTDTAIQVYAIMFAIGRYDKTIENWNHPSGKKLEVAYYTEPEYTPYARGMFKNTPEMMSLFSRVTGVPYPWEKYSQITARDYVSGAMENTSASLFGEFMNQNNRQLIDATTEDVVSHELFHQWFGDYVTAESWSNLTVNESFATFGEIIWREHKYGRDNADELAYEDLQRYINAAERLDPPLVRFHYRDKEEMFDRISYQKGGAILRYIRSIAGDSAFNRAMNIYLTENAHGSAEATHWRLALEKATGQDWTQFFNEWYLRGGHPELVVTHSYDDAAGKLTIRIRQKSAPDTTKLYHLPLEFRVVRQGAAVTEAYTISRRQEEFQYSYTSGQRPFVVIDPLHLLPGVVNETKAMPAWVSQISNGGYGSRRAALNAAIRQQKEPEAVNVYKAALQHADPATRLHALNMLSSVTNPSWQETLKPQLQYILQNEGQSKPLAAALRVAGNWSLRNERRLMEDAVWDSSYFVAGAALTALNKIDKDSAYVLAKRILPTQPRSALSDAVWQIVAKHGERQDFGLLERYSAGLYGKERQRMMERLSFFASETSDDNLYQESLQRIAAQAALEQDPATRAAVGGLIIRLRRYYDIEAQKEGRDADVAKRRGGWAKVREEALIAAEKDETVKERLEQEARGGSE